MDIKLKRVMRAMHHVAFHQGGLRASHNVCRQMDYERCITDYKSDYYDVCAAAGIDKVEADKLLRYCNKWQ